MRASEALMIGSLQLKRMPYCVNDGKGNGCAIGMLNLANGRDSTFPLAVDFPWLGNQVEKPCNCAGEAIRPFNPTSVCSIMVHLFNEHVCRDIVHKYKLYCGGVTDEPWTLEQLADWLESVDPTPKETETREAVEVFCENLVKQ